MEQRNRPIKALESQIIELRRSGKTRQEIADALGLSKVQVKNWINRYNKRMAADGSGIPKPCARKPAVTLAEYKCENKRLKMENELLRDFLRLTGRR